MTWESVEHWSLWLIYSVECRNLIKWHLWRKVLVSYVFWNLGLLVFVEYIFLMARASVDQAYYCRISVVHFECCYYLLRCLSRVDPFSSSHTIGTFSNFPYAVDWYSTNLPKLLGVYCHREHFSKFLHQRHNLTSYAFFKLGNSTR